MNQITSINGIKTKIPYTIEIPANQRKHEESRILKIFLAPREEEKEEGKKKKNLPLQKNNVFARINVLEET